MALHDYTARIEWTGNTGRGNRSYRGYDRTWSITTPNKPVVLCSNDPVLGGDPTLHNPEDLLLTTISSCHMLWYLHLASDAGIIVTGYSDEPLGVGEVMPDGAGRFLSARLRPVIDVTANTDLERADELHHEVSRFCFIARSLNFPLKYEAEYRVAKPA